MPQLPDPRLRGWCFSPGARYNLRVYGQQATMIDQTAENSMPELRRQIRDKGLRCTTARLTVLQSVVDAKSPVSHAELADRLAAKGFDRATIYRNLVELAEVGLLS